MVTSSTAAEPIVIENALLRYGDEVRGALDVLGAAAHIVAVTQQGVLDHDRLGSG